ncbi:hypothetical protein CGZ75_03500 [Paenibacillus herberti]|uniref:Uncharacterized protein n=1 Tax=Paenibacillus herberti TaxID=1619309 RepID=A0A229P0Z8_9BACL|nr:hypothetical protein CGZ75_03500 [Paenibacillus herberti]
MPLQEQAQASSKAISCSKGKAKLLPLLQAGPGERRNAVSEAGVEPPPIKKGGGSVFLRDREAERTEPSWRSGSGSLGGRIPTPLGFEIKGIWAPVNRKEGPFREAP